MELKTVGIIVIVVAILSAVTTRYYFPKVSMQTVEVEKEVVKNNIVTITKTIKGTDGTEETTTTTTDKSTSNSTASKSVTITASKDWMISASAGTKFEGLQPIYGLQVQRRILGPIYVGAMASTDKMIGLSVGFEF